MKKSMCEGELVLSEWTICYVSASLVLLFLIVCQSPDTHKQHLDVLNFCYSEQAENFTFRYHTDPFVNTPTKC